MIFRMTLKQLWLVVLIVSFSQQMLWSQEAKWTRSGNDWPTFLGNKQDGNSLETGIRKDWSAGKLPLVWTTEVGEGYSIGSVANGRYVHFDRANRKARVRCFNAETGKLIWQQTYASVYRDMYGYDSGPRTTPIIDGNRVFTLGVEGQLKCWNLNDGTHLWSLDIIKKFGVVKNFFGVGGTPAIHENLIIVMVGGSPAESQDVAPGQLDAVQPNGSAIVAFNKETGKEVYRLGQDLASYASIKVSNELDGEPTGLAFCRNSLIGFDAKTGKQKFQWPWRARILESVNASTPIVQKEKIFITECYGPGSVLLKFQNGKTSEVWSDQRKRVKSLQAHWNTPILKNGFIYASSGRNRNADFRCIELSTGKLKWAKPGLARSSATWIDHHFVVLGENGDLVLLNENSEKYDEVTRLDWKDYPEDTKLMSPCWSAPVISHGLMWVKGKRKLHCFELIPE